METHPEALEAQKGRHKQTNRRRWFYSEQKSRVNACISWTGSELLNHRLTPTATAAAIKSKLTWPYDPLIRAGLIIKTVMRRI